MATLLQQHGTKVAALAIISALLFVFLFLSNGNSTNMTLMRSKLTLTATATVGYTVHQEDHDTSGTVADHGSPHNYENVQREACNYEEHGEGLLHAAITYDWWNPFNEAPENLTALQAQWRNFTEHLPEYSDTPLAATSKGRGIVYSCGTESFNTMVVSLRMLRALGCRLPIEVWHFAGELNDFQMRLLGRMGVTPRDVSGEGAYLRLEYNPEMAKPYDIKPTSMINSAFEEVLFLDSDNLPLRDPTYLFDRPEFKTTGAVMFPDFWQTDPRNPIYKIMDVPCWREREVESGQLLVNKRVAWKALNLAWFLNRNHPVYYKMLFGDKDTFRFAWKALKQPYHLIRFAAAEVGFMTEVEQQFCGHTLGHHDPDGDITFLHTHLLKWHDWKGKYPWTHFRDSSNGFRVDKPFTHVQEPKMDPLEMEKIKPTWLTGWPEVRCLQYIHMKLPEDKQHAVRLQDGDPNKPKTLFEALPIGEVLDEAALYQHFDEAEGPMLMVAPGQG